jgi:hypothetical protein
MLIVTAVSVTSFDRHMTTTRTFKRALKVAHRADQWLLARHSTWKSPSRPVDVPHAGLPPPSIQVKEGCRSGGSGALHFSTGLVLNLGSLSSRVSTIRASCLDFFGSPAMTMHCSSRVFATYMPESLSLGSKTDHRHHQELCGMRSS